MAAETKTVIGVVLSHKDPLPEELATVLEQKVYDWLNARGILAIPEAKVWYALEVREQ